MFIHGCSKCHHEWESVEADGGTCGWCNSPSHNLGSTAYWDKMEKLINRMKDKIK